MKSLKLLTALFLAPAGLTGQPDPVARLREVLPPHVAEQVLATVTDALSRGLPADPIAMRALEGAAKGKSAEEIGAATRTLADQLARADAALERNGRTAQAEEIEAAVTAMQLGVEGAVVSDLASSAPSGRSLAVPLAVVGALVNRGIPADEALAAVLARLQARASNAEIAALPSRMETLRTPDVRGGRGNPSGPPTPVPSNGGKPRRRPFEPPAHP